MGTKEGFEVYTWNEPADLEFAPAGALWRWHGRYLTAQEARTAYNRWVVPTPGRVVLGVIVKAGVSFEGA